MTKNESCHKTPSVVAILIFALGAVMLYLGTAGLFLEEHSSNIEYSTEITMNVLFDAIRQVGVWSSIKGGFGNIGGWELIAACVALLSVSILFFGKRPWIKYFMIFAVLFLLPFGFMGGLSIFSFLFQMFSNGVLVDGEFLGESIFCVHAYGFFFLSAMLSLIHWTRYHRDGLDTKK